MFTHINTPVVTELQDIIRNGKRWYKVPSGDWYASATTILGGTMPKEKVQVLDNWRNSLGNKKASKELKRCGDRGTAVHYMIEQYLNNVENPAHKQDPLHEKMFNQSKVILKKINNVRAQEIPLYSDNLKIAGRVDCVAEYDGVLSIIDFKTSSNVKDTKMVEDYRLQTTAYAIMYDELFDVWIDNYVIIIAVEKGIMPMVFKGSVEDHIEPLVQRVSEFYKNNKYIH